MQVISQYQFFHKGQLCRPGDKFKVTPAEYEAIKDKVVIVKDEKPSPKRMKTKPAKNLKTK